MARQLQLLEVAPDWRLDDETRAVGRKGLESARAALAAARRSGEAADDGAGDTGQRRAA